MITLEVPPAEKKEEHVIDLDKTRNELTIHNNFKHFIVAYPCQSGK